jgi:hypothetical protein
MTGFVENVLSYIKGGDKGKILKFQKRAIKALKNNIKATQSDIEDFESKLEDVNEALADAGINLDMDRLSSTDAIDGYVQEYLEKNNSLLSRADGYQDKIINANDEISAYEKLLGLLK